MADTDRQTTCWECRGPMHTGPCPTPVCRRAVLAVAIQHMPEPIRAADLAAASAAAGFGAARNTARTDARALVRRGLLAAAPGPGNRTYTRPCNPEGGDA